MLDSKRGVRPMLPRLRAINIMGIRKASREGESLGRLALSFQLDRIKESFVIKKSRILSLNLNKIYYDQKTGKNFNIFLFFNFTKIILICFYK